METPFYDPSLSYEDNYQKGPFGEFATNYKIVRATLPQYSFLGHKIHLPFGIPAGPLLNSKFISAAFNFGYDLCVYKTVRTRKYPCHPWPNIIAVHQNPLPINYPQPLVADYQFSSPVSITNSFGVPSANPDIWQEDMARAVKSANQGQVLIGSFQGTNDGSGNPENYIKDFTLAAKLVKETGAPILEANLSCPNEGTQNLLCFDTQKTLTIATAIKNEIGSTPLILKLAYFKDNDQLEKFVQTLGPIVDGFAAINTINAAVVDQNGNQILPGIGRNRSGICGTAINWAGLEMTKRLADLRTKLNQNYSIIGVGGVMNPNDFENLRLSGADAVMSATGAMWNTHLAEKILSSI